MTYQQDGPGVSLKSHLKCVAHFQIEVVGRFVENQ